MLKIKWNCSLSLMTFSISLPIMLRRTIGLKALGESYDFLLDLEMIDIEILKCKDQWPKSKYASAILIIFFRYNLFLAIHLRCLHDNLLEPKVKELLHLAIELMNYFSENRTYLIEHLFRNSFNIQVSI